MSAADAANRPSINYDNGKAAFAAGDYPVALRYFQAAQASGYRAANLLYNTGVTHYKLGQLDAAAEQFRRLLSHDDWRVLASYNIGVIAESSGEPALAEIFYRDAIRLNPPEPLEAAVQARLSAITETPPPTADESRFWAWTPYFLLAYGYDDNPARVRGEIVLTDVDTSSDRFTESFVHLAGRVPISDRQVLNVVIGAYSQNFASTDTFDITGATAAVSYRYRGAVRTFASALKLNHYFIDSRNFSTRSAIDLNVSEPLSWADASYGVEAAYIAGGDEFRFLNGWQYRLNLRLVGTDEGYGLWSLGYRYEQNNRNDLELGGRFVSFSPQHQELTVGYTVSFIEPWSIGLHVARRWSRYDDEGRLIGDDGIPVVLEKRSDDRLLARMALNYQFSDAVQATVAVRQLDADSNIDRNAYDSRQFTLGFDLQF